MILKYSLRDGFVIGADIAPSEISVGVEDRGRDGDSFRRPVEVFPIMSNGSHGRMAYKTLFRDEHNGRLYFSWNQQRVYVDEYIRLDYNTLINKLKYRENVDDSDIACFMLMHGVSNIRIRDTIRKCNRQIIKVGIEILVQSQDEEVVEYQIVEDKYKLADRFKVELRRADGESGNSYVYDYNIFMEALKNGYIEIVML